MKFCSQCGYQVADNATFCTRCGAKIEDVNFGENENFTDGSSGDGQNNTQGSDNQNFNNQNFNNYNNNRNYYRARPTYSADRTEEFDAEDIERNKTISLFSYLGILFVIPLLASGDSKYVKFHVNQGAVLFIASIILDVFEGFFTGNGKIFSWFGTGVFTLASNTVSIVFGSIFGIIHLIIIVYCICGIVNAVNGKAKELPLIGNIHIIK